MRTEPVTTLPDITPGAVIELPGRTGELAVPLTVEAVSRLGGLVAVAVYDAASLVWRGDVEVPAVSAVVVVDGSDALRVVRAAS